MWLGISVYMDGMDTEFKKADTKEEIIDWLRNDLGYDEEIEGEYEQDDGISYNYTEMFLHTAWIVNLGDKKEEI